MSNSDVSSIFMQIYFDAMEMIYVKTDIQTYSIYILKLVAFEKFLS